MGMAEGRSQDSRTFDLEQVVRSADKLRNRTAAAVSPRSYEDTKCGLWLSLAIQDNWNNFSPDQQVRLQAFLAPALQQKSRIIGIFQIHYDSSGIDTPFLLDGSGNQIPNTYEQYVDSVGKYFNEVYDFEVNTLGYESPLQPGDTAYDVYIRNMSAYGLTRTNGFIGAFTPPRYRTYIEIDNDFRGFYSPGILGLKVTAAHEFHHAIQLASYGVWSSDQYFLEITSTWMEDVVYGEVNDYYQYLEDPNAHAPFDSVRGQFATSRVTFTQSNGLIEYSRAIWGKFIEKKYSRDVMKRVWEYIRTVPSLTALDLALTEQQSSFRDAFLEWAVWNSQTGPGADTVNFYSEGLNYPQMKTRPVVEFMPPARSIRDTIQSLSSTYRPVVVDGNQMLAIISNVRSQFSSAQYSFEYQMQTEGGSQFKDLANGIHVRINVPDPENWVSQETVPSVVSEAYAYPNPFLAQNGATIKFRLPYQTADIARLHVFSSSLNLIFAGDVPVVELMPLESGIVWDAYDDKRKSISSGIYFFAIVVDGKEYTGKFSVVRQ